MARPPGCPLCASARAGEVYENVRDLRLGTPGNWSYVRCLDCGAVYLTPRLDDPAATYPEAYSQHVERTLPDVWGERLILPYRLLRQGVLHTLGYRDFGLFAAAAGRLAALSRRASIGALYGHILLPRAVAGGKALDLGCGNGHFLAVLKELGWQVCGVEPDPVSAEFAKKIPGAAVHPSLRAAGFSAESFDRILMNHVLEHLPEPAAVLAECRRLLKADGRIGICVPNWNSVTHGIFGAFWKDLDPPRHLTMFEPAVLRTLLEGAGFAVENCFTTSVRYARYAFAESWTLKYGAPPPSLSAKLWPAAAAVLDALLPLRGEELVVWAGPRA